jgi:hypothetical protein
LGSFESTQVWQILNLKSAEKLRVFQNPTNQKKDTKILFSDWLINFLIHQSENKILVSFFLIGWIFEDLKIDAAL